VTGSRTRLAALGAALAVVIAACSSAATPAPTAAPTAAPTPAPTMAPTPAPTMAPTPAPTAAPTTAATDTPAPATPAPTPSAAAMAWDQAKAAAEAGTWASYGMPDDWANYGESIKNFCAKYSFTCNPKRSLGEDMSSAEEIAAFDAEKNNPKAIVADIGILFASQAEQKGVVSSYVPAGANKLAPYLYGQNGGWTSTFVGVPGFVVNVDYLTKKGVPVPTKWADLADPKYKGMVGFGKPGSSGTATMSFVAQNLAAGGTLDDYTKGVEYAKKMVQNLASSEGNADSFEKGEVPIQIKYDFNLIALANAMKKKNVNAQVVIPTDGSIYAPSALIMNKYDTAHADFGMAFMDWVLSDEGQTAFAKFGARPIRWVTGDLKLDPSATTGCLPDSQYSAVQKVDTSKIDITKIADIWENQVLAP
jgi:putative spermidine/putrescine transport system substrate-binding protein